MAVERSAWVGLVNRAKPHTPLTLTAPLAQSNTGSSGTFRGICSDGQHWWVKPINQLQAGKTIVNDQIVARVGLMIGAPVCSVALVEITSDTAGWEFRPGQFTAAGLAHGSLHIGDPNSQESTLRSRDRDNNAVRHAGVYALWDWCHGADDQWLYASHDDERVYAHDLGHFLPGLNNWTSASLEAAVDQPRLPTWPPGGLDPAELDRLADALENLKRADLVAAINGLPSSWPVTDAELEVLGWFLERRANPVAERLRQLARTIGPSAP